MSPLTGSRRTGPGARPRIPRPSPRRAIRGRKSAGSQQRRPPRPQRLPAEFLPLSTASMHPPLIVRTIYLVRDEGLPSSKKAQAAMQKRNRTMSAMRVILPIPSFVLSARKQTEGTPAGRGHKAPTLPSPGSYAIHEPVSLPAPNPRASIQDSRQRSLSFVGGISSPHSNRTYREGA